MRYCCRQYTGKSVDLDELTNVIVQFFREENFKVHALKMGRRFFVQARKGGMYRPVLSNDHAFTMAIEGEPSDFKILLGVSPWHDMPEPSAAEPFFSNPISAFTEVKESIWSYELEHNLWHYIENQIELGLQ